LNERKIPMSFENTNSKRSPEGRWRKGASGNPAGRPTGSRNQSTAFFAELLNGQGEALIQKAIELSLQGDTRALSICWDRLLPPRKERTIEFPLPPVMDGKSVAAALASVVAGVAEGRITPGEAECLARILETQMRVVEFEALAQRIAQLEKARTQTTQPNESLDGATLDWVARNYSNPTSNCGEAACAHPDEESTYESGVEKQPLPALNSETTR
jgi:hypothetical protein